MSDKLSKSTLRIVDVEEYNSGTFTTAEEAELFTGGTLAEEDWVGTILSSKRLVPL